MTDEISEIGTEVRELADVVGVETEVIIEKIRATSRVAENNDE